MSSQSVSAAVIHFAHNGANRPLHQDRQVLRADDLALEQATQDAMLARARRYLHGWGVVAGFEPTVTGSKHLVIGPGYGVTPLGDELFMPEATALPDAGSQAVFRCGPGPVGCDIVDAEELAAATRAAADATVTAWLIARPASREVAPRPGVPEGCAHPAATLLPSRRCGGVEFDILCALPPSHQPKAADCAKLMPFVCGIGDAAPAPLPWESPLATDADFLVIAHLTVTGGTITATTGGRRTLWPVALLQDWIAACLCPALERVSKPPPDTGGPSGGRPGVGGPFVDDGLPPATLVGGLDTLVGPVTLPGGLDTLVGPVTLPGGPDLGPVTLPGGPDGLLDPVTLPGGPDGLVDPVVLPGGRDRLIDPVAGPGGIDSLREPGPERPGAAGDDLAPLTRARGPAGGTVVLSRDEVVGLRDRLGGAATEIAGVGAVRARLLADIGVTTEGEFLTAPPERLATSLSLPTEKVEEMKEELSRRHNLGLRFR